MSIFQARANALAEAIEHSDAVVFVKPGGLCPFCNLASKALLEAAEGSRFSLDVADLFNEDRDALREMLGMPVLTWPVCFFKGRFVEGGGEAIATLHKEGVLVPRICEAERVAFAPLAVAPTPQPRPLLHQAGGGPWRACQQRSMETCSVSSRCCRSRCSSRARARPPRPDRRRAAAARPSVHRRPPLCVRGADAMVAARLRRHAARLAPPRHGPLLPYKVTSSAFTFCSTPGPSAVDCPS